MPNQSQAYLKALGLYVEPNQIEVQPGSLVTASNVVIRRDDVIEPRRGFALYGTPFGTSSDLAAQLMQYQNTLILNYDNKLAFDTQVLNDEGQSIWQLFPGTFEEVIPGLRMKSVEANDNLYFTTAEGIQKISVSSAAGLATTTIVPAGGIQALDITTSLNITQDSTTGFLPQDSAVSYRALWGFTDPNNNLILGTPSSPSIIYNPLLPLITLDYMTVLYALDQLDLPYSYYTDANYVAELGLTNSDSATDMWDNLQALSAKLDAERGTLFTSGDIVSATINSGVCTIVLAPDIGAFGQVAIGDNIYLNNFVGTTPTINGPQTVTSILIQGTEQVSTVATLDGSSLATTGPGTYWLISSANNAVNYYVWYQTGSNTDPAPGGTGIPVTCLSTDSNVLLASETVGALNGVPAFSATYTGNIITITNTSYGPSNISNGTSGYTIAVVTPGTNISPNITFTTTAVLSNAAVPINVNVATITSGSYEAITVPTAPAIPATDQDLVNLQTYLQAVITELQAPDNLNLVAANNGTPANNPLDITSATVAGGILTVTFNTTVPNTSAENQFRVGDYIFLSGTWDDGVTNISGPFTIATVTTNTITANTTAANNTLTLDTTSVIYRIQKYTNAIQTEYLNSLSITTTANVNVTITIPPGVTVDDFFQIYRGDIITATGTDVLANLIPDDEDTLVYEGFPTQAEINAGFVTVVDIVPESFSQGTTDLYTNQNSGEGIDQANNPPPLAQDIANFKGYTWYANTSSLFTQQLSLLGVEQIISDYENGLNPSITISNGVTTNTYLFILGVQQIISISTVAGSALATSGPASYFTLWNATNAIEYYVWYSIGTATDPMIPNATGIQVYALAGDSADVIASKTTDRLNVQINDFTAIQGTNFTFNSSAVDTSTNTITIPSNGFANGNGIIFNTGEILPGGLIAGISYYIINATTNTFQVSTSFNGSAVILTSQGFGTQLATYPTLTNQVTVVNINEGIANAPTAGTSGFTTSVIIAGAGQDVSQEITNITAISGNLFKTTGTADYFTLNTAFGRQLYAFWFDVTGGTMTPPVLPGITVVPIVVTIGNTANQVASAISSTIITTGFWTTTVTGNVVTITGNDYGPTPAATDHVANGGFSVAITQVGALDVLLSNSASPAIAIQQTAESLVQAININSAGEIVSAFYLSGISGTPGQILLQAQGLSTLPFYVTSNTNGVGISFQPNISPEIFNITNTTGNPTVVSAAGFDLINGDKVLISGSNSVPSIDGVYTVSGVVSGVSFTIPVDVVVAGTTGSLVYLTDATVATNDVNQNRVYYSKLQQPDAVPLLNYLDVGANNFSIVRIFALRDSLFVFKQEGLYRISSTGPPWDLSLFDANVKITAADSLSSSNNLIYLWAQQGIMTVSEAGSQLISRPIDTLILPISSSSQYANFSTLTWGVGYDSDNAYYVFTVQEITDAVATICYRYSNLTNTWTTYDMTATCGIVDLTDDKLYLGAGDTNFIEQERKNFNRTDYADRQYTINLVAGAYFQDGASLIFPTTDPIAVGDVIQQTQTLTTYTFNMLLKKLDIDPTVGSQSYFANLEAFGGDNLRSDLVALAAALDADSNLGLTYTFAPSAVNTGTNTITITGNGFEDGNSIVFSSTGILPGGLTAGTTYFIVNQTTNTIQISTVSGGSPIILTSQGTGTHTILRTTYSYAIVDQENFPIVSNSAANPTIINAPNHGLLTSRFIQIAGMPGITTGVNDLYYVTRVDANNFSIPLDVLTAGTGGTFTTLVQDFRDIESSFNIIVTLLNASPGTSFKNYQIITNNTSEETIVTAVNAMTGEISLSPAMPFVIGPMTLYKAIDCIFTYCPITMGDPLGWKQIGEATIMFQDATFTNAIISFSTDLLPQFIAVPFNGLGNGIFGSQPFGSNYFGGNSHSAPFRTYVPMQCQRCRYINIMFEHDIAREKFSVYGVTLTGRAGLSSRAYRSM